MLIDDIEDKYIELLEGTGAHRQHRRLHQAIATALDDDFNTQFYFPAFREVREASRFWDVQPRPDRDHQHPDQQPHLRQGRARRRRWSSTCPSATSLINEAMNGRAMIETYGALVNDPTFLALTKLRSGQPTSSLPQGSSGAFPTERNVLPGLPRLSDEKLVSPQVSGKHCGQVGQPSPEPVTRTTDPVTAMPAWVITAAIAVARDRVTSDRFGAGAASTALIVGSRCVYPPGVGGSGQSQGAGSQQASDCRPGQ